MKALITVAALFISFAAHAADLQSFACRELNGGQTYAEYNRDTGILNVENLAGRSAEFQLVESQPTVLGGTRVIARSADFGYALINVGESATSTLQALSGSAYMTCHETN